MSIVSGDTIDGRFELLQLLGQGGYGVVFKANDKLISRTVAIKVLTTDYAIDRRAMDRFEREAKILSALQHKNLISVFSFGQCDNAKPYLVMPFLDGETLRRRLDREGPLNWSAAVSICTQLCEGAEAAHRAGIVHRDLKPENIMLAGPDGEDCAKILDFGLSAFCRSSEQASQKLTETGMVVGTPQYMAPESVLGQVADQKSDIYSLGCMLYEMLSGQQPFPRSDVMEVLYCHLHEKPLEFAPDLQIPKHVERSVFKAMQKTPENRFSSMEQFRQALQEEYFFLDEPDAGSAVNRRDRVAKNVLVAAISLSGLVALAIPLSGMLASHSVPNQNRTWKMAEEQGTALWQHNEYDRALDAFSTALKGARTGAERAETEEILEQIVRERTVLQEVMRDSTGLLDRMVEVAVVSAPTINQRRQAAMLLAHSYLDHDPDAKIKRSYNGREVEVERKKRGLELLQRAK